MNDIDLQGVRNEASPPGKENKHFHIAPLDPVLKDGGSALRQHFVHGERAGQRWWQAVYMHEVSIAQGLLQIVLDEVKAGIIRQLEVQKINEFWDSYRETLKSEAKIVWAKEDKVEVKPESKTTEKKAVPEGSTE